MKSVFLCGALVVGCSGSTGPVTDLCASVSVVGIHVTVVGGALSQGPFSQGEGGAGGRVAGDECAATVTAVEGVFSERLECSIEGSDCTCWGVNDRPGDYRVTVTLGERSETQTAEVRMEDECRVKQVRLTFFDE